MIMCGLKKHNSTVKAKQAVMDVAYYTLLKGSTANAWVTEMDGALCIALDLQIKSIHRIFRMHLVKKVMQTG